MWILLPRGARTSHLSGVRRGHRSGSSVRPANGRRTPSIEVRRVSKKRARENRLRRKAVDEKYGDSPACEVLAEGCTGRAVDVHEPLTRARGGSIVDPDNMVAVCRVCHDWIHANPVEATELGWLRRQ